jgi:bifunctional DNA-binding transcriptional regulator/antitoxin component of YhaV-PrlF toxin-antitoxin module
MQKKLAIVGNSLALVIDKPLRRMLGLRPDTMVRLTIDGRRLIIEPLEPEAPRAVSSGPPSNARLEMIRTLRDLGGRYGMTQDQFRRLHHGGIRLGAYHGQLASNLLPEDAAELATMQRLKECLRALHAGASWDDAITAAQVAAPLAA